MGASFFHGEANCLFFTALCLRTGLCNQLARIFHGFDAAKHQTFFDNLANAPSLPRSGFFYCPVLIYCSV